MRARPFILLYLLSGAAALLYEVAWLRLLTMTIGHATAAVGAVLAAFMGGLAVGAWSGGRISRTLPPVRALRLYAALETAIALSALALPYTLAGLTPLLAWAYANGNGGATFDLLRVAIAVVLLAIPAAAMGASFPVGIAAIREIDAANGGSDAGALYAANTVGAAFGAALTGFVLLPRLGLVGTTLTGVSLNAVAALGALFLSAWPSRVPSPSSPISPSRPSRLSSPSRPSLALPAWTLGFSGFVALVYEVTWTRVLATTLGPTTYAFSAMLVAFIAGLAIGSAIAAMFASRVKQPGVWLGVSLIAAAVMALLATARVDRLPLTIAASAGRTDANFSSVFALDLGIAIAMQLPMTFALGAAFPFALATAAGTAETDVQVASIVYSANTAGAIAGALAGSFVLIPLLGLQRTLQTASVIATAIGWWAAWRSSIDRGPERVRRRTGPRVWCSAIAVAACAVAVWSPAWNHTRLVSGAYRLAPVLATGDVEAALDAGDLTYYREGATGTVSVRELIGVRSLAIDGKVDASNGSDMLTQKLLAHLPLLLHEAPKRVYIIGLGSGVTLAAALTHPIERAVVSEISPEVVAASRTFRDENHDALRDPRTRLIVGDGRSHLLLSDEQYDVIISEPSNPWMAGVSTLFTREFFAAAQRRLRPGGILCQWAHTYNISDDDLRSIVGTFLSAFPNGSAWLVGESDLLLVGSTAPLRALDDGVATAWSRPGVAADLAEADVRDPFSVMTLFVARGADLRKYAGDASLQSDDRLALEYSAPRAIYGRYQNANVGRLRTIAATSMMPPAVVGARAAATAENWVHRAEMQLKADSPALALQDYVEALAHAPTDPAVLSGFVRAAAASNQLDVAERYLRGRIAASDSAPIEMELSRVLAARGDPQGAVAAAQRGAALEPSNDGALEQLVSALADNSEAAAVEQLTALLVRTGATRPVTLYAQMRLAQLRGRFQQAAVFGDRLTASGADGENAARNYNLLGIAYESAGDHDRARQAFEASLKIAPKAPAVLMNLGLTELRSGRADAAQKRFAEALYLYPTLIAARDGLAQAREHMRVQGGHRTP